MITPETLHASHPVAGVDDASADAARASCSLCRDEAARATVVEMRGCDALVRSDDGCARSVAIDFVPGIRVGDRVLVRLDVAIGRLEDPE